MLNFGKKCQKSSCWFYGRTATIATRAIDFGIFAQKRPPELVNRPRARELIADDSRLVV